MVGNAEFEFFARGELALVGGGGGGRRGFFEGGATATTNTTTEGVAVGAVGLGAVGVLGGGAGCGCGAGGAVVGTHEGAALFVLVGAEEGLH